MITVDLPNGQQGEFPDDMPHEEIEAVLKKQFPPEDSANESPAPKPELKGWKGLGVDTVEMLRDAIKGGIGFTKRLPENLKEIATEGTMHPLSSHNEGQLLASVAETGKNIINTPHNILSELGRKDLIPEGLKKYNELPFTHIPEDTGIQKFLGLEPTRKSDELIRALPVALAAGAKGISSISKGLKGLKAPDLKPLIKETQSKVNNATKEAGNVFNSIESEVEKRGISKVSIDPGIIDESERYLSRTPANKALIEKARTGDYAALRKLQADLRVKGEKALSSSLKAENDLGEEMLANRDAVNSSIENHLEDTGHKDLAKSLGKVRNDYREIMDTYFSSPALAKVFGKSQKVPKNPMTLLTEDSTEMNQFMSKHPEVKEALAKALKHKTKMKILGAVGSVIGTGTAAGSAYKILGGH